MMQECAAKWRSMDDTEKIPYSDLANKDKERWLSEKAAEKKPKDQWRPKRPPSAYFLFLKDFRADWKLENDEIEAAEQLAEEKLREEEIAERLSETGTPDSADKNTDTENPEKKSETNGDTDVTKAELVTDEENNLKIDEEKSDLEKPPEKPLSEQTLLERFPPPPKKEKKLRKTSRVVVS